MKQIIKHLHQYIGCNMVWNRLDKSTVIPITAFGIHLIEIGDYEDIRIILKELKDISDEDLEELNNSGSLEFTFYKESIQSNITYCYYGAVDMLRSKGYAVGIEKKYYTNENK